MEQKIVDMAISARDSQGNLYVPDGNLNMVEKFDSDGNFLLRWGTLGTGMGEFSNPRGITIDHDNNIVVFDEANYRLQVFNSLGVYQDQIPLSEEQHQKVEEQMNRSAA